MRERSDDQTPHPIPREWLPDPRPPEGSVGWDAAVERIMAAADPDLRRLRSRRRGATASDWSAMARWWKSAAALAAAATALLLVTDRPAAFPEPPPSSISLSLVPADGDPVMLWEAFWEASGIPVDPVLSLITFPDRGELPVQGMPRTTPEDENR